MLRPFLSLLAAGMATMSVVGLAADKLDGLDQTMQVLDDVGALQSTLARLPSPEELLQDAQQAPDSADALDRASETLDARSGFLQDIVIDEDDLPFEDDFEEGEDVDDDRFDEP
jgi:hypothetical protein